MLEMLKEFICPELVILVPVIYITGMGLKKVETVKDKYIPALLGVFSVLLVALYVGATKEFETTADILIAVFTSVTQGVLCAGASVYINQIIKQEGKDE